MGDDRFDDGESIVSLNIRSMMCAPLIHQDDLYGIVHIDTTQKGLQFANEDLDLLMGIANQAAIFMRNAELVKSIESESKMRANYERYFSPSTQDRIRRGEVYLGGSMKRGSVFFSDIIGFTRMSQERSPSEVVTWLNRYFRVMVEIITKHRGTIDKFGGDSILAVWGIEEESDGAMEAVRASLQMQNALYDFNFALIQSQQPPIQMGIGINSGSFIFGNIGSELRTEYTVIGSDVNMAQRVESKATRGQVYISDTTFAPLQGKCVALRLPPTFLKGRSDPITIYSIRGMLSFDSPDTIEISLPVEVKAEGGGYDPYGLLVRFMPTGKAGGDFILHSAQDLPVGERTNCRMLMPEYQDFPAIEGTVCETQLQQPEHGVHFMIIRLRCEDLDEYLFRFLSCDFIPDAMISADEIKRA
jgi:adenylate cyclase